LRIDTSLSSKNLIILNLYLIYPTLFSLNSFAFSAIYDNETFILFTGLTSGTGATNIGLIGGSSYSILG
jgi:hypothetical protein